MCSLRGGVMEPVEDKKAAPSGAGFKYRLKRRKSSDQTAILGDEGWQLPHIVKGRRSASVFQHGGVSRRAMTTAMEAEHRHAGDTRAGHTGHAVLHDDALLGCCAHLLGREQ